MISFFYIKKHILNIQGKRINKKYLIFESDDWGSERIPSKESREYITSQGIDLFNNPFNYLDSLESEDDLTGLLEILIQFTDYKGNHPAITANSVVANPDFKKIKEAGFTEYHYENVVQTYSNKKNCENSLKLIREGIENKIFHPQFHGREHLNIEQWLSVLRDGDQAYLKAFNHNIYSLNKENSVSKRNNLTAAFDIDPKAGNRIAAHLISDGTRLFSEIFGYKSASFIAPCYLWHPSIESILLGNGVKFLQGIPYQYSPDSGKSYNRIFHYQGQKNSHGQLYFIRNCFFEPALRPHFNWISEIMKRLEIIFFWGKPAIIGTHRLNFMGTLDENNRKKNLTLFSELLKRILIRWPDVEFTTTDKLGESYQQNFEML